MAPTIRQRARREEGSGAAFPVLARRCLCGERRILRGMVWGVGAGPLPVCRSFRVSASASKESRRRIPWWTTCEHPFWGPDPFWAGPRTNDEGRLSNLVEEFLNGLADALHAGDVPYRQIRMGDVPTFCRDLMLSDPVFHLGTVNSWPAFPKRKENVHFVGDLRHEVLDVGVP